MSLSRGSLSSGVSVQRGLCPRCLCPEGSLSRGVSVQGVGGSLSRGSVSSGVCVQWGLCPGGSLSRGLCPGVLYPVMSRWYASY